MMNLEKHILGIEDTLKQISENSFNINPLNEALLRHMVNEKIIQKVLADDKPSKEYIEYIHKTCKLLKSLYDSSDLDYVFIDDDLYDKCIVYLSKHDITVSGSEGITRLVNTTEHEYPELKGTTHKAKYIYLEDVDKGENNVYTIEEFFNDIVRKCDISKDKKLNINISFKNDGLSVITKEKSKIKQGITRGKDGLGADITHVIKNLRRYNYHFDKWTGVKNEIMLTYNNLKKYNELTSSNYKNTRSAINSILNNPDYANLLTLVPLDYEDESLTRYERILELNKIFSNDIDYYYRTFKGTTKKLLEFIRYFYDATMEIRPNLPFEIDGLVIEILDDEIREKLGRKNDINNYEIALKFPSEIRTTKVIDVKLEVGSTGTLTPLVFYEPVTFTNNTTHKKSSISSYGKFKEMELKKGDIVDIKYVNDVICQVFKDFNIKENIDNKNDLIPFPDKCPLCEKELEFTDRRASCPNPNCYTKQVGAIVNFGEIMSIRDVSDKTIISLLDEGIITNIIDLMNIKKFKSKILQLEGFGELKFSNIANQIEDLKDKEIFDYMVLASIGIPDARRRVFKTICEVVDIDEIIEVFSCKQVDSVVKALPEIKGIGYKTIEKIFEFLKTNDNMKVLKYLRKNLKVKKYKDFNNSNEIKMVVRMSGVRIDKDDMEKLIMKGVDISDGSITKKTTHLIIPDENYVSSKVTKAETYGNIIILTKEKFYEEFSGLLS